MLPMPRELRVTLRSSVRGLDELVIRVPLSSESEVESVSESTDATYSTPWSDSSSTTGDETVGIAYSPAVVINKSNCPSDCCAVCLDSFKPRQHARFLVCSHKFHRQCLDRWLSRKNECPVCRSSVRFEVKPGRRSMRLRPET